MTFALATFPGHSVRLEYARVCSCADGTFGVRTGAETVTAKQADGCLLQPQPGDTVLLSLSPHGNHYILTVIERARKEHNDIVLSGDVTLTAMGGSINLEAEHCLNLESPGIRVDAQEGALNIESCSFLGKLFNGHVESINLLGKNCNSLFKRMTQRLEVLFRHVSAHEEMQAASSRRVVDGHCVIQAENTTVLSEKVSKIDGKQVQLG